MTTVPAVGAVSHPVDWRAIDWRQVERSVRRLQARIVKATQDGRWGKVQALQRLLTHSYSGKALAVRRVTENDGKRTPGVDKVIWNTPEEKATAIQTLRQHGYQPQPLRRVWIPKSNGQQRPLGIPTMRDRAMQALYLFALAPVAETTADPNSYGFRPARSTADAMVQCHNVLAGPMRPQWILEGDIKACFDRISHEWLLRHIPMDKTILHKWLKAGYMDRSVLHPTTDGTPQGGIISPVLANMTLDGLERHLRATYPLDGKGSRQGRTKHVNVVRYADDFIITGRTKELLEDEVKPLVTAFLAERGLELSPTKTTITHVTDGFDFLGQTVRKFSGITLVSPAKAKVKTFLRSIRTLIKTHPQARAGDLIWLLNPILRGWANFHRHANSKETFNAIDAALHHALWRWARRRHHTKSCRWIRQKYFQEFQGNQWTFTGERNEKPIHLFRLAKLPIRPHRKIKGDANPFDPAWEEYFEERISREMYETLEGRRQVWRLWEEQAGRCPVCDQRITKKTRWHVHHIIWRSRGGPDTHENRVLLHPACHRQVHSQKRSVVKPRPSGGDGEA